MIVTPRFGKKTNKNDDRKKNKRGGTFIPGGTSNPDTRVGKPNFLSDRNSEGNSRILLPFFYLLLGNIIPISQSVLFSQNFCQF